MTSIKLQNSYGSSKSMSVQDDLTLDEMFELFGHYLKGAGYFFSGEITILDLNKEENESGKKKK